jgi:hypothetical protein
MVLAPCWWLTGRTIVEIETTRQTALLTMKLGDSDNCIFDDAKGGWRVCPPPAGGTAISLYYAWRYWL